MLAAAGSGMFTAIAQSPAALYLDASAPVEQRVDDLLSRMSLDDKIAMIHAQSKFSSPGVKSLGVPELWTSDGPHGIRPEVYWDKWSQAGWTSDSCVAFPALTCLAATWNPEMALLYGRSIGEEARYRRKNVLLGPGVNIARTPLNGRNFEYMGEDPYLASTMVVPYIKGVQENGVATCVKHYALNNQELNRHTTNVTLDDRALYEIYLPAFKAAVKDGGSWSIMGSYNLYNGEHGCHNKRLLCTILRDEWGYDGAVISDWGGTHSTPEAIANGLDLEFGTWTNGVTKGKSNAYDSYFMANPYKELIKSGESDTAQLNEKVRRILRLMMRTSMNGRTNLGSLCSDEHYNAARKIAQEGIVLLKNTGNILPLDTAKTQRILIVGENAIKMMTVGGGSSSLKAQREILPIEGIKAQAGPNVTVDYARGYVGDPTGEYNGVVAKQDLKEERSAAELFAEAVQKAREADCVVFIGGLNKSKHQDCEDSDRETLELPYGQDSLIQALSQANKNLVVVNISGNPVAMPWVKKVPGIVQMWYLGSEAGNALADVLFGHVNPSGKLPVTFPVKLSDVGVHALGAYPGVKRADADIYDLDYKEGLLVGYRWFDTQKVAPLFPFGHGLSYTTFAYGKAQCDKKKLTAEENIHISVPITNTGNREGAEVVQLYISDPKCTVMRPEKELKGFKKIFLHPGETETVTFTITPEELSYFDDKKHQRVAEAGTFKALIGTSSGKILATTDFTLSETTQIKE
ncbi:MAG: glycoside hydrolase family 3 C-terminal domain-containing protein [Firmicutes bacterium]|nr:glycoside hydrolase family 3 C-terminal domain-containing protein [Bacillota bacterium]MCM1401271.1 glycoside hydrolase family 3 C-terminal domain-containing protein [Bacteroides sp.]MCM1476774.1 glycoside hydrolase family 3 C-terminal domain-containing protein [Bacteroides sp.]